MTLQQLEYAVSLQKHKNYNKAAQQLSISQPALSLQIKKLEEEIGIRLFNRNSSPVQVTSDGEQFLQKAQQVLLGARQLAKFSEDLGSSFEGNLKVGIIPTLAPFLVPLFIEQLNQDYPEFNLEIFEVLTNQVITGVQTGEYDVGIISTPLRGPDLVIEPLFFERFYFYAASEMISATPVDPHEIPYEQLWLLNEGNCFRDQVNDLCNHPKIRAHKQFVYRSNSIDALIRIVDSRGGLTLLPELSTLTLNAEQEERIYPIKGKTKVREISLIMNKNYDKERFISTMKDYIQQNIPAHMLAPDNVEIVDPQITI